MAIAKILPEASPATRHLPKETDKANQPGIKRLTAGGRIGLKHEDFKIQDYQRKLESVTTGIKALDEYVVQCNGLS